VPLVADVDQAGGNDYAPAAHAVIFSKTLKRPDFRLRSMVGHCFLLMGDETCGLGLVALLDLASRAGAGGGSQARSDPRACDNARY